MHRLSNIASFIHLPDTFIQADHFLPTLSKCLSRLSLFLELWFPVDDNHLRFDRRDILGLWHIGHLLLLPLVKVDHGDLDLRHLGPGDSLLGGLSGFSGLGLALGVEEVLDLGHGLAASLGEEEEDHEAAGDAHDAVDGEDGGEADDVGQLGEDLQGAEEGEIPERE